jgi:hypothetical protein
MANAVQSCPITCSQKLEANFILIDDLTTKYIYRNKKTVDHFKQ